MRGQRARGRIHRNKIQDCRTQERDSKPDATVQCKAAREIQHPASSLGHLKCGSCIFVYCGVVRGLHAEARALFVHFVPSNDVRLVCMFELHPTLCPFQVFTSPILHVWPSRRVLNVDVAMAPWLTVYSRTRLLLPQGRACRSCAPRRAIQALCRPSRHTSTFATETTPVEFFARSIA